MLPFFSVKKSFSQSSHYFARLVGWCFGILPGKFFVSDACACIAWFRIYVNPCIPGGIRVKTLQNLICLLSKHLGVLKNLFKRVCAFQIDLEFASVGF